MSSGPFKELSPLATFQATYVERTCMNASSPAPTSLLVAQVCRPRPIPPSLSTQSWVRGLQGPSLRAGEGTLSGFICVKMSTV